MATHSESHSDPKIKNPWSRKSTDYNIGVNSAFTMLRTLIPTEPADRKLSKIETLRLASSYISHLGTQLLAGPVEQPCLRPVQHSQDHQLLGAQRSSVCTFCLANQKKMKASASQNLPEQYNFSVSTHSSMMFYSPQTMVSVTTSEMSPYFY